MYGAAVRDSERGMVFFSTGQPKGDFYRPGNAGDQLYGNSIVALDAATGKRKWHYQTIHKDLWDLDLPCAPVLVDLKYNGKAIPGVAQLSKTGNVFLFNRETGEPVSKIEERPAAASVLEGEAAAATQPFVSWPEPYAKQVLTEQDIFGIDSVQYRKAKAVFDQSQVGWFIPPSTKGILYYGIHGGSSGWRGVRCVVEYDVHDANEIAAYKNERYAGRGRSVPSIPVDQSFKWCSNAMVWIEGWDKHGVVIAG